MLCHLKLGCQFDQAIDKLCHIETTTFCIVSDFSLFKKLSPWKNYLVEVS